MMSHWGVFPQLTMEVLPQGIDATNTYHKDENRYPMGLQQHAMIIYIITFEFTNTSTIPLN